MPEKDKKYSKLKNSDLNYLISDTPKTQLPNSYGSFYGSTGVGESQYDKGVRSEDLPELEEIRAQEQSNWDRWGNAIPRLISKVGTEVLKTPGYLYGLGEAALTDATLSESLDNAWLNSLEGLDQKTKEEFAIYKPKAVREGSIVDNLTSASFYTNEGVDGLGFLLSMMAPGAGIKALGMSSKLAKLGMSAKAAEGIELGSQTLLNSGLEAAAEAKGQVDNLKQQFFGPEGLVTTGQLSEEEANKRIETAASDIFKANMALLLVPNAIMNKNLLGRFNPTKSTLDKITDAAGNFINNPITKKQMIGEYAKGIGMSALSEGFLEEGGQFAIEDYTKKVALGQTDADWMEGLMDSYADALTTTEGQKSIFLGSLLGSLGGAAGQYKTVKGEQEYKSNLSKLMRDNFDGFSSSIEGVFEKDKQGNVIYDENNRPKVNIKKAAETTAEVIKETATSNLMEYAALTGNKEAYDYLFNQSFSRFALPYLKEEGGLDLLDKHIDRMSSEFIKNQAAMEGVPVNEVNENKYKQDLKQKARTLDKVYQSIENTLTPLFLQGMETSNPQLAGEFINKLKNTALFETSKQLFYKSQINDLQKQMIELQSAVGIDIPQNRLEVESLQKKSQDYQAKLEESINNYNSILNKVEQRQAFSEFLNSNTREQSNINKQEQSQRNFGSKLEALKAKLVEQGYSPEEINSGTFAVTSNGQRADLSLADINDTNIDSLSILPKSVLEKEQANNEELNSLFRRVEEIRADIAFQESILSQNNDLSEQQLAEIYDTLDILNLALRETDKQIADLSLVDNTQTQITGDAEPVDTSSKEVTNEFKKAAKPTVFSSAGNHEQAIERNDVSQIRWFNTLNKLKNSSNYYLKFVNRDTMPEAFDALASNNQTELEYELANPDTKGLKGVLVDVNGSLIKADNDGNFDSNGKIISTTIHTSNHIDKLNPNIILFEYLQDKGNLYSLLDIQTQKEFDINDETISKDSLLEQAKSELKDKIDSFRENIKSNLDSGLNSFTKLTSISNGIPNKLVLDVKTNKRQRNNILENFVRSSKDVARIFIGDNTIATTLQGKPLSLVSGGTYVENKNGEVTDAINRTLEDNEVSLVIDILNYAFSDPNSIKTTIKSTEGQKEYPIFFNSKDKEQDFILSKLIFYGKAKNESNKKYQIFADYKSNRLFFGDSSSIGFSEISSSEELKSFLKTKFLHVNKSTLNKNKEFLNPISLSDNKIEFEKIEPKDGLGGYEIFLLRSNNLSTDIVPINSNQPQYLQKYVTFENKVTRTIEPDTDSSQISDEEPEIVQNDKIGSRLAGTSIEEATTFKEVPQAKKFNPNELLKTFNPKIIEESDNEIIDDSNPFKGIASDFFEDQDFRINNKFNIFFNKERIKNPDITVSEALFYFKKCK
jgi:hypothetical protein